MAWQLIFLWIGITVVLYAAWRIGFSDGREKTLHAGAMTIQRIMDAIEERQGDFIADIADIPEGDYTEHVLTYADLEALDKQGKIPTKGAVK